MWDCERVAVVLLVVEGDRVVLVENDGMRVDVRVAVGVRVVVRVTDTVRVAERWGVNDFDCVGVSVADLVGVVLSERQCVTDALAMCVTVPVLAEEDVGRDGDELDGDSCALGLGERRAATLRRGIVKLWIPASLVSQE